MLRWLLGFALHALSPRVRRHRASYEYTASSIAPALSFDESDFTGDETQS